MNSVSLTGTLVRDPEMKQRGERKICELRVAELGGPKNAPLYVSVATFGRQAETCAEFLSKGRHVAIVGQLRFREWKTEDGSKRSEHSIAADRVDFLAAGEKGRGKGGARSGRGESAGNGNGNGSGNGNGAGGYGGREAGGFEEEAPAYGGGGEPEF